jgi:hypothetical protein
LPPHTVKSTSPTNSLKTSPAPSGVHT